MNVGVLYIHGVHGFESGYADLLHDRAADEADALLPYGEDAKIIPMSVYWADIFEAQRATLKDSVMHGGLTWKSLRNFVATSVAHAVGYEDEPGIGSYERVHERVSQALATLASRAGADAPLIIVSHSLGTVVLSNYIWDRQHAAPTGDTPLARLETLKGIVTMGSPLALYASRWQNLGTPIKARSAGIIWRNLIAPSDVLAWPLTTLNFDYSHEVESDIRIRPGGLLGWTPFAHVCYWKSMDVADKLGELIAQVYKAAVRNR